MEDGRSAYWLCTTKLENFEIDRQHGFRLTGFRARNAPTVKKFKKGDKMVIYIHSISRFGAIVEITSDYYHSEQKHWVDEDEMWPARADTKPIIVLEREQFLDVRKLIPSLSFVPKGRAWGMAFHGSIRSMPEDDFKLIESEMRKASILSKRSTTPQDASMDEENAKKSILGMEGLESKSLHDRLCEMLATVGTRMGFNAQTRFPITPEHAYELDVAWLRGKNPELAIEVQIGGNITEAKERLAQARRFNYRKVVMVIEQNQIKRLNGIIKFDDLKNWLEAWSIPSVYEMYTAAEQFFGYYDRLQESRYRERDELGLV